MRRPTSASALTAFAALALSAAASSASAQSRPSIITDLLQDIEDVQTKLVGLARAMPADKYTWSPGEGVRSVGEVFLHVASDNYLLPTTVGVTPPAATGITNDYMTATAYEKKNASLDKDAIIAQLEQSFAFLKKAVGETSGARLGETISLFGGNATVQKLWILTATHLHEHLGQAIAYARSNGVVPPWSR
jgi:uncharacterized damage-inducible protein DinB